MNSRHGFLSISIGFMHSNPHKMALKFSKIPLKTFFGGLKFFRRMCFPSSFIFFLDNYLINSISFTPPNVGWIVHSPFLYPVSTPRSTPGSTVSEKGVPGAPP